MNVKAINSISSVNFAGKTFKNDDKKQKQLNTNPQQKNITSPEGAKAMRNLLYGLMILGAAGGVIGGAFYLVGDSIVDLFKKGSNVNLEQGQILDIMLTQPIDIPVH